MEPADLPLSCALNYTVVGGDICNGIWSEKNLSSGEFLRITLGLYIEVDGGCPIEAGDILCITNGPSPTAPRPPSTIDTLDASPTLQSGPSTPGVAGTNNMRSSLTAAPTMKPPVTGLSVVPIATSSNSEPLKRWPPLSFTTPHDEERD